MCGIAGILQGRGTKAPVSERVLEAMGQRLVHRGPDDFGLWSDVDAGIGLAHTRLSIVDLSAAGHQPMVSASGRYVLVFNGEIYNHLDIRRQIDRQGAPNWRGRSDTETLLAAIDLWGLDPALKMSVGMFAVAVWDRRDRRLLLARDRMGEKPLYYGWQNGTFLFGSELKALRCHPDFGNEVESSAVPLYMRHGYIPAPWSIWKGVRKLLPGTWISISPERPDELPEPVAYWSLVDVATEGQKNRFDGAPSEAVDALEKLLGEAISGQRLADVPLGAFLSGGVDSSTVVALMQSQSTQPVRTFTIGFDEAGFNEAEHAKSVARHLGTVHTEMYVTPAEAREVIPNLPEMYDEPFGDSSAIPTYLVSRLAREHVTVALSGDGGDELFGGYDRYSLFARWQGRMASIPAPLRKMLHVGVRQVPIGPDSRHRRRWHILSDVLGAGHDAQLYRALSAHWLPSDNVVLDPSEAPYWLNDEALQLTLGEPLDHAVMGDMQTYLPDDVLTKVDRAAMAISLETRVPLLDHRIVEWSWTLPVKLKGGGGHEKRVLKDLLYRYVPRDMMERPKMGFGVPIGAWLRGPLRAWSEDLLDPAALKEQGWFDPMAIERKWRAHQDQTGRWEYLLWDVLMFQAWLREQRSM